MKKRLRSKEVQCTGEYGNTSTAAKELKACSVMEQLQRGYLLTGTPFGPTSEL